MSKREDFEDNIDYYDNEYEDDGHKHHKRKNKSDDKNNQIRTTIKTTMVPVLNKQYLNEALILNIILGIATGIMLFSPKTMNEYHSIMQWSVFILSIVLFGRSFTKSNAALANGLSLGAAGCYLLGWGTELFNKYFSTNANTEGFTLMGASFPFIGFILSVIAIFYILITYGKERR